MRIKVFMALALCAAPALAQQADDAEDGLGLIERGTRMLLEEFMRKVDPALEELQRELGPALDSLREGLGRLDAYHPPEILPNGDIILRRKTPAERAPDPAPELDTDGAIDL